MGIILFCCLDSGAKQPFFPVRYHLSIYIYIYIYIVFCTQTLHSFGTSPIRKPPTTLSLSASGHSWKKRPRGHRTHALLL